MVVHSDLINKIVDFYNRDDVSRMTAGKKETITRNKQKRQKRLLTDTLINMHLKFKSELAKVSYSLFCRVRPFYVVPPTERDRETCTCKVHDNLQFVVDKLQNSKILPRLNVDSLCKAIVCSTEIKQCMYGECVNCKNSRLEFQCAHDLLLNVVTCQSCQNNDLKPKLVKFDPNEVVTCHQWVTKIEDHDGKTSTVTVKELETISLHSLVDKFHTMLSKVRKHIFNIRHQYIQYRELRSKLTDTACMIHIDFAENYLCQYNREIQSVHFGGSHKQTTMHTGVLYVGQQDPQPFCTVSDSRMHDPVAIWCYLQPVLDDIAANYPAVTNINFFSDGPTTQYRQKKNFYLFSSMLSRFQCATWNFFESSHGKRPAYGVGAVLKRTADRLVRQGADLPNARTVFEKLQSETAVKLFFVCSDLVDHTMLSSDYLATLPSVPVTMMLHQITIDCSMPGKLRYRDVSCFCSQLE